MEAALALPGLAVVHLLAVASPGPSTVLVIQTAAVAGRRGGLLAAFAMMVGALAWAAAALYGLQALFARSNGCMSPSASAARSTCSISPS